MMYVWIIRVESTTTLMTTWVIHVHPGYFPTKTLLLVQALSTCCPQILTRPQNLRDLNFNINHNIRHSLSCTSVVATSTHKKSPPVKACAFGNAGRCDYESLLFVRIMRHFQWQPPNGMKSTGKTFRLISKAPVHFQIMYVHLQLMTCTFRRAHQQSSKTRA